MFLHPTNAEVETLAYPVRIQLHVSVTSGISSMPNRAYPAAKIQGGGQR